MTHLVATEDAIRWLRTLPAGSVDHMLSDPPYSSGGFNESQRRSGSSQSKSMPWLQGDALWTLAMAHLLREVALEARRVIKPGGTMSLFSDWKMVPVFVSVVESAGWRWRAQIVWDKMNFGHGRGWMPQHEMVLHFADASTRYVKCVPNVIRCARVPNASREHPTQKPVDLLCALLAPVVEPGTHAVIADPFAGSGSLIEACQRLGLTAWCCDADPAHAPAMQRRAEQRGLQGGLL